MNEYTMLGKTFKENAPRSYQVGTSVEVQPGHTFILDGIVWIVGDVDADLIWCVPWLFDRTRPIDIELVEGDA